MFHRAISGGSKLTQNSSKSRAGTAANQRVLRSWCDITTIRLHVRRCPIGSWVSVLMKMLENATGCGRHQFVMPRIAAGYAAGFRRPRPGAGGPKDACCQLITVAFFKQSQCVPDFWTGRPSCLTDMHLAARSDGDWGMAAPSRQPQQHDWPRVRRALCHQRRGCLRASNLFSIDSH